MAVAATDNMSGGIVILNTYKIEYPEHAVWQKKKYTKFSHSYI